MVIYAHACFFFDGHPVFILPILQLNHLLKLEPGKDPRIYELQTATNFSGLWSMKTTSKS